MTATPPLAAPSTRTNRSRNRDSAPLRIRRSPANRPRKLLVLSREHLSEEIESYLKEQFWEPVYAGSEMEARSLAGDKEFLVGLVALPHPHDSAWHDECRNVITTLSRVEWIAALALAQIEDDSVRHLIVENLRDFQVYPLNPARLSVTITQAYGVASIGRALCDEHDPAGASCCGLIGKSRVMRDLFARIRRIAEVDELVLIQGETGTGKEKVARAIHALSDRASGPFVAFNCAAVPQALLESELFGHEKGAFTDAFEHKMGRIEAAASGCLLLDEIGEMPAESQGSLLRFLEDGRVSPLGSTGSFHVDVRVFVTTNRDLEALIKAGAFRADLFYRLSVLTVRTPNLKERDSDIKVLANHFLAETAKTTSQRILGFTADALRILREYEWPGNIRELRNTIIRAALTCSGRYIGARDLDLASPVSPESTISLRDALHETELQILESTLKRNNWHVTRSARDLDISRMTIYRLMAKHGITRKCLVYQNDT